MWRYHSSLIRMPILARTRSPLLFSKTRKTESLIKYIRNLSQTQGKGELKPPIKKNMENNIFLSWRPVGAVECKELVQWSAGVKWLQRLLCTDLQEKKNAADLDAQMMAARKCALRIDELHAQLHRALNNYNFQLHMHIGGKSLFLRVSAHLRDARREWIQLLIGHEWHGDHDALQLKVLQYVFKCQNSRA